MLGVGCFETPSLPTLHRRYPRDFIFYVARPTRSILPAVHVLIVDFWNTRLWRLSIGKSFGCGLVNCEMLNV
jgi:hypothetical protein